MIMKFRVPKVCCHTGHYLKDNEDMVTIRLAYDTNEDFVSNWTSLKKGYVPKARRIGHDDASACYVVDGLVLNTAPHKAEFHGFLKCFTTSYEHKRASKYWCRLLRNTTFSPTGKISVVKDRTKFKTFCVVLT